MFVVSPDNHTYANKVWLEQLNGKPNGARTLGAAAAKYLSDTMATRYDMLVTYASDMPFDIPDGVKTIAVMWHQNYPWSAGISAWRKMRASLASYEVECFCNEQKIVELIREQGGTAFYLPRFIDTTTLPAPKEKRISNLWFGNRWGEFGAEFERYKERKNPYWISQGVLGLGEKEIADLTHEQALEIVAEAKNVWAIGLCQLEARHLGANVFSYRGDVLPFYDQTTIVAYLEKLLSSL